MLEPRTHASGKPGGLAITIVQKHRLCSHAAVQVTAGLTSTAAEPYDEPHRMPEGQKGPISAVNHTSYRKIVRTSSRW